MNRAVIIAKKNQLWSLIKRVGAYYHEDLEFIKEYAKDVYENNDVDEAIKCFEDLLKQTEPKKATIDATELQRVTNT